MDLTATEKHKLDILRQNATTNRHRQVVLISGSRFRALALAEAMVEYLQLQDCLWVTDQIGEDRRCVLPHTAGQYLGTECHALVYDCFAGLNANALAAFCGTIVGGGFLFWITPAHGEWAGFQDPDYSRFISYPHTVDEVRSGFLSRIVDKLYEHPDCFHIEEGQLWPKVIEKTVVPLVNWEGWTPDQEKAVAAVHVVAFGHRHRPLVIAADRGRGKSSALGAAVACLFERGLRRIVLTAPSILSVEAVYEHAQRQIPHAKRRGTKLMLAGKVMQYVPPDEVLRARPEADCLLVDESASIPTPLLQDMATHYARIVFVTTVNGYEGTGRGFALRFEPWLNEHLPQWRKLEMELPIRWAHHDPLERLLYQLLLLQAQPLSDKLAMDTVSAHCQLQSVDRTNLARDERSLHQLMGLLTIAHYRTTPDDLRYLLDSPNLRVWVLRIQSEVIGAVLLAEEGGYDSRMAEQIWQGKRRPRGSLLPQSLAAHLGVRNGPELNCARIVRIAVHPLAQRHGLGSVMMDKLMDEIQDQYDIVGASFGANASLLRFWRRFQFQAVRVGVKRDASSGLHSILLLRPGKSALESLVRSLADRFNEQLPLLLTDYLKDLSPDLVLTLLAQLSQPLTPQMNEPDCNDVEAYVRGYRQYEAVMVPIWKFCLQTDTLDVMQRLPSGQRQLLTQRVLQKKPWRECVVINKLVGRRQAETCVREILVSLWDRIRVQSVSVNTELGRNNIETA